MLRKHDRICAVFVTADVYSLHGERVRMKLIIQLAVHLQFIWKCN